MGKVPTRNAQPPNKAYALGFCVQHLECTRYEIKRPTADGRTHLTMTGVELLRKLAPLVPPPKQNLTRYHGVFAPNSKLRVKVTGTYKPPASLPAPTMAPPAPMLLPGVTKKSPPSRIPWADLLKRVFATDVLACMKCGGRRRVIACVNKILPGTHSRSELHPWDMIAVQRILRHLELPDEPMPTSKARGPPQVDFAFD